MFKSGKNLIKINLKFDLSSKMQFDFEKKIK